MPQRAVTDPLSCQACGADTDERIVLVTMWNNDRLLIVENVPARVCDGCQEQYYDDETSEAILRLASTGFPECKIVREITVPVFAIDRSPILVSD